MQEHNSLIIMLVCNCYLLSVCVNPWQNRDVTILILRFINEEANVVSGVNC